MAWLLACTSLSLAPEEGEGVTLLFCSGELFTPLCCGVNGCVCCRGMWNPSRSLDRSRVVSTPVGPGSTLQALQLAPERTKDWNLLFFTLEPAGVKQRPRLQLCCPCRFLCTLGLSSPNRDLQTSFRGLSLPSHASCLGRIGHEEMVSLLMFRSN